MKLNIFLCFLFCFCGFSLCEEAENVTEPEKIELNCTEDFLETLTIERVLNGITVPSYYIKSSELELETSIEATSGFLEILCAGQLSLRKLSYLKLSNVKLQEIQPYSFKGTPELREVNFKLNELTEIGDNIFSNTNLVVIKLESNKITHISENAFDNMPELESVDLDQNKLTELNPNWFTNTPNMHYISLNFNNIKKVPANAFKYINEFDGVSIYLIYNDIEEIAEHAFANFKQYGRFQLDNNRLQTFPKNILSQTNHTFDLSLYGNYLNCIPDDILHTVASSCKYLDIRKNPFDNECLKELKSYKLDNSNYVKILIKHDEQREKPYHDHERHKY